MHGVRYSLPLFLGAMLIPLVAFASLDDAKPTAEKAAEKPAPSDKQLLEELLKRLDKVESELGRLRAGNPPAADRKEQKLLTILETPHLGSAFYGAQNGSRFFAARLILVNQTDQPVTIKRDDISLQADDTTLKLKEIPSQMQYQSFQVGNQNYQLRNLKPKEKLTVAPGGTGSTWVVFTGIANGTQVPKLNLKIQREGQTLALNVNDFALGLLGLSVERIGPRGSLGLLTISGEVNTISIGSLIDALSDLTTQKISRAVIRWSPSAAPVDPQLANWLQQAAFAAGRSEANENAPAVVPAAIRELHLSQIPSGNDRSQGVTAPRVHKTDLDAIEAALESAYEILPLDELITEIENGHPLARAAALARGGGRLPSDKLPLILGYADDKDPQMQRAAIAALQHFGDKEAVEKLTYYVRKNTPPTAAEAIESLAASRFTTAHQALLEILKSEGPQGKKLIVSILAKHPRPIWSDTIYEFVSNADAGLSTEALRALVRVGHPKLLDVLSQALTRGEATMRNEAFQLLVQRTDRESEEIALNFTLKHLETSPPGDDMIRLLDRTKDPRAVPLLIKLLDTIPNSRQQIITTLSRVGDQSVADVLVAKYPTLAGRDKAAVLTALIQLKSPAFRKLAGEALLSPDGSVVSQAAQGLQNDGSAEAVRLLAEAFDKTSERSGWSHIANALGTLGTPEAQAALRKGRDSENEQKRNLSLEALQNLRRRSPGFSYILQAQQAEANEKWDEAKQRYSSAIELDPQLPDAFAGRGHALLMLSKSKEAQEDFKKAVELEPYSSIAITGLAVTYVLEGKVDEGIKYVEDARPKFPRDQLYFYNTACVYGRAVEALQKPDDKTVDREKKLASCREKAVENLRSAMKHGFGNVDWIKKDPDLKSLHELGEFKKIVANGPPEEQEEPGNDGDNGDGAGDSEEPEEPFDNINEYNPEAIEADLNFINAEP
ncbi:MAG: HEAT repeat domain-containing protein [Planctomycetaceae bacterium]